MSRFSYAGVALIAVVALSCSLAASAAESQDPKKDPRRTYSTEGWKLAWSDEFDGNYAKKPNVAVQASYGEANDGNNKTDAYFDEFVIATDLDLIAAVKSMGLVK